MAQSFDDQGARGGTAAGADLLAALVEVFDVEKAKAIIAAGAAWQDDLLKNYVTKEEFLKAEARIKVLEEKLSSLKNEIHSHYVCEKDLPKRVRAEFQWLYWGAGIIGAALIAFAIFFWSYVHPLLVLAREQQEAQQKAAISVAPTGSGRPSAGADRRAVR